MDFKSLFKKRQIVMWVSLTLAFAILASLSVPVGYYVLPSKSFPASVLDASVHRGSICAYIINLDRSKGRYGSIRKTVAGLQIPVMRLSAIDGQTLSQKEITRSVDLEAYKTVVGYSAKVGQIGCSLSHIKAWRAFLDSSFEFALIFEDDVSFDPKRVHLALEQLMGVSSLWDIVNLDTRNSGGALTLHTFPDNQKLVVYLQTVYNASAYLISRKAASHLLAKALPITMPVDHYFRRNWELGLTFTGLENPRLVHQTFGDSTIVYSAHTAEISLPFLGFLKHKLYRFQTGVMRIFSNLNLYWNQKMKSHAPTTTVSSDDALSS